MHPVWSITVKPIEIARTQFLNSALTPSMGPRQSAVIGEVFCIGEFAPFGLVRLVNGIGNSVASGIFASRFKTGKPEFYLSVHIPR